MKKVHGLLYVLCVMASVAFTVIATNIIRSKSEQTLTAEQFSAQVAEANRQTDVASQLRAAERGYLVEWKNGHLQKICDGGNGGIIICEALALGRKTEEYWEEAIERVIRPTDPDWGEVSFQYLRQ